MKDYKIKEKQGELFENLKTVLVSYFLYSTCISTQ